MCCPARRAARGFAQGVAQESTQVSSCFFPLRDRTFVKPADGIER
jgi:hypothetical protein